MFFFPEWYEYTEMDKPKIYLVLSYINLFILPQVDAILDKENVILEELLDEEEIIQECKALNSRLINL